jgi:peptide/nickel transport system ATP-binding protein
MTDPVLEVTDLAISFSHPRPAVNSISVRVEPGEIVALVGESGSGKSMTARAVLGLLPPGAQASGSVRVQGREVLGAPEKVLNEVRGAQVAMVFQEPQTALNPVRTVGWQVREAIRAHHKVSTSEARRRAVELLTSVEIPDPEQRVDFYPHQLSGGQKQRVVLALALANEPALLLADEPTTALDVTVQAEILDLLGRLRDRIGTSILLITHNMGVVARLADRVVVLQTGDVVESAETTALFHRPQHAYTRQLLGAVPRLPSPPEELRLAEQPAGRHTEGSPERPAGKTSDGSTSAALVFEAATVVYRRSHGRSSLTAVEDVSLAVPEGEVLGLVGESGSGKTTLGRAAAGLVPLASGRVLVEDQDLGSLSRTRLRELRKDLAFVHQDPASSLDPRMTLGETIREPLDVHKVGSRAERDERVRYLLDAVRLPASYVGRRPRELSGGQRQRVALARALALQPRLVIADEPTSALDVSVQAEVLALFRSLQEELRFSCVFISHDLAVVHDVAHRVGVLRCGRLVESGPVAAVFARPSDEYTRRLLSSVPVPDPTAHRRTSSEQVRELVS